MVRAALRMVLALMVLACAGQAASAEKRVALVIGNSAYTYAGRLANPRNDAADVAAALSRLGFEVTPIFDSGGTGLARAVDDFLGKARGAEIAVFYYAGHGLQYDGAPYLLPVDAKLENEFAIKREALAAQDIVTALEGNAQASIVVLDACRNNPLAEQLRQKLAGRGRGAAVSRGLGRIEASSGNTLVVYSAGPGQEALDGGGRNSPFTAAFLKHAETPGLEVEQMLKRVTAEVETATAGKQQPERLSRLKIELWLKGQAPAPTSQTPLSNDAQAWSLVQTTTSEGVLEEFIRGFPDSVYARFAKARLEELKKSRAASGDGSNSSWWPFAGTPAPQKPKDTQVAAVAPPNAAPAQRDDAACGDGLIVSVAMGPKPCIKPGSGESFRDCPECPEMVIVPSGSFRMGSLESEPERQADESPQHRVAIAQPFAVGKFAVTFAEWDACVDAGGRSYIPGDKGWGRADRPVINVSWDDAKIYLAWLSKKTGKRYRLLSEAEREYAARAGTAAPFWWGSAITPEQANYDGSAEPYKGGGKKGEYRQKTMPVSAFKPNPWGLYQVHGNVLEWVEDCWNGNYSGAPSDGSARTTGSCGQRVIRGGSWSFVPGNLRAAFRFGDSAGFRFNDLGFRVARTF